MQVTGAPFRRYPKQIINIHADFFPWEPLALAPEHDPLNRYLPQDDLGNGVSPPIGQSLKFRLAQPGWPRNFSRWFEHVARINRRGASNAGSAARSAALPL
jgi:hypothetical protein